MLYLLSVLQVNVQIKWELVDEDYKNIVCIEFPAKVK